MVVRGPPVSATPAGLVFIYSSARRKLAMTKQGLYDKTYIEQ